MRHLIRTRLQGTNLTKRVELTPAVLKSFKTLPGHVANKLLTWVSSVEQFGLENVRRVPGYHDEPLKGDRSGQRSIRLSIHYRAIYVLETGIVTFVRVTAVNKHTY